VQDETDPPCDAEKRSYRGRRVDVSLLRINNFSTLGTIFPWVGWTWLVVVWVDLGSFCIRLECNLLFSCPDERRRLGSEDSGSGVVEASEGIAMMGLRLIEILRGIQFYGANVLEWLGVVFVLTSLVYTVLRIRQAVSAKGKVQFPAVRGVVPPKNGKSGDWPQGDETILLVDDDASVLRANSRLVSRLGYDVRKAGGGEEAVEYIRGHHADLIILDLLMPGMDGIEAYQQIKRINPHQKAIVLSGFAGPAMVSGIKSLGVSTYLVKPVEMGVLARAIREEIERA
jgi:CheY-like chemotaxis protein